MGCLSGFVEDHCAVMRLFVDTFQCVQTARICEDVALSLVQHSSLPATHVGTEAGRELHSFSRHQACRLQEAAKKGLV